MRQQSLKRCSSLSESMESEGMSGKREVNVVLWQGGEKKRENENTAPVPTISFRGVITVVSDLHVQCTVCSCVSIV